MYKNIYDITKELLSCEVYEEDTKPTLKKVKQLIKGDEYNLSDVTMCLHNGTHMDAPYHFINDGNDIEQIPLEDTIGVCIVAEGNKTFDSSKMELLLNSLTNKYGTVTKLLLKGSDSIVTYSAAKVLVEYGIRLIGVETDTVGDFQIPDDIANVHQHLLQNQVIILENLNLKEVKENRYWLFAQPLKIRGADGAPCRAILVEQNFFL